MDSPFVCFEREAENEDEQTNKEQGNGQQNVEQLFRTGLLCIGFVACTQYDLTAIARELAIRTTFG